MTTESFRRSSIATLLHAPEGDRGVDRPLQHPGPQSQAPAPACFHSPSIARLRTAGIANEATR